jgi:hypothetical protein
MHDKGSFTYPEMTETVDVRIWPLYCWPANDIQLLLVAETFYSIIMVTLKISLALFYLRIMVEPVQRSVVLIALGIAVTYGIVYFFFIVFQCGAPIQGAVFWQRFISKSCVSDSTVLGMAYSHSAINSITDLVFAALPVNVVWSSQMGIRQKILVSGIMMVGTM